MKIVTASEAAGLIQDGWTVTTGGFGSCGHPEAVTAALAERFTDSGHPRNLRLVFAAGQGDRGGQGLNRLAHDGLVASAVGGFWGLVPALGAMARSDRIEAHNWPQGVVCHMFRATAAGQPGVISRVGLHTFIDPEHGGGSLNTRPVSPLVRRIVLEGEPYLFYPRLPLDCAIIRGTRADTRGNITMEREVSFQDGLAQAQAVRNSGGIVIAQVEEVVPAGTLPPHQVKVPGILVDYVVEAAPEWHQQTYGEAFNPLYTEAGLPDAPFAMPPILRRIIARRALAELRRGPHSVVNLGIGMPADIGALAAEAGIDDFTLTVEAGAIGGAPASGLSFGASAWPQAVIEQSALFDFYDGGGIDIAFLGFAQADSRGNVNVSRFRGGTPGVGGFVNISQAAKRLVFCGSFTADGLAVSAGDGRLAIMREGAVQKFVQSVEQISFNGGYAGQRGQDVAFVTERAVFRLSHGTLRLTEIAPGIDMYRDIIGQMAAAVVVDPDCTLMDAALFDSDPAGAPAKNRSRLTRGFSRCGRAGTVI